MSKDKVNFEQSLTELEKISNELESNDIALDKAIELFEKGIKLSKECSEILQNAKQRIECITDTGSTSDD